MTETRQPGSEPGCTVIPPYGTEVYFRPAIPAIGLGAIRQSGWYDVVGETEGGQVILGRITGNGVTGTVLADLSEITR
jgi:hypothetical protein